MQEILKTSSKSDPNKVAGAIAGALKESESVEIQAVGAGAVNQAVKAVASKRILSTNRNIVNVYICLCGPRHRRRSKDSNKIYS